MIRLGLGGINQTPLDWKGNLQRIWNVWARARDMGIRILCLPELCISGYGCEDAFLQPHVSHRALSLTRGLAWECGDEVLIVGLPFFHKGKLYNGAAVLNRGRIRGISLKSNLAGEGIHYEPRWFHPWPLGKVDTAEIEGDEVPIGTLSYNADGFCFGMEICEDAWTEMATRPCSVLHERVHWILNPSASHFSMRKADIRERIIRETTERFPIGYGYANLVGCESGRAIYDGELMFAENGAIIARSPRLYMEDDMLLAHDVGYTPRSPADSIELSIQADSVEPIPVPRTQRQAVTPEEEFTLAATLALFDYMRKSRGKGFTLSLSGGVDSSAVAVLVYIMAERILAELSPEVRQQKLDHLPGAVPDDSAKSLTGYLLTTVYQSTRNSGEITRTAARLLAEGIGAKHLTFDVDGLVQSYTAMVGEALGRGLSWESDDVALQNIQARVRGPGVWMLANINGSLLLSTSNRSEVAVGYATMDGDTCGGLAPIAGVEKTFLRRWLRTIEKEAIHGFGPIPELSYVNKQQPTAELRPPDAVQQDEKDLMPYEVLDALETQLIARRRSPMEAFDHLMTVFSVNHTPAELFEWTCRFCRLFAVSQWKRERYAPTFHLDDRNLDPKTWSRYPILSGAFQKELEDLEVHFRQMLIDSNKAANQSPG